MRSRRASTRQVTRQKTSSRSRAGAGGSQLKLVFREIGADEVEKEVTQRDQFNSDEVDLVEALVPRSAPELARCSGALAYACARA